MIGRGLVDLKIADFLAARGVGVVLVDMLDDVSGDMDVLANNMLLKRLGNHNVKLMPNTKVLRLTKDTVIAQHGEGKISLPIETIVIAVGVQSNRDLPNALNDYDLEIHTLGDAVEERTIMEANWEGF